MDEQHHNPLAHRSEEPSTFDDATMPQSQASLMRDAVTVPLAEFSLTRNQVVEMYAAAGIKVEKRTISRYAQEGLLRAEKVDAERGLKRYLFDKQSVEEDIARRLRGPSSVYALIEDGKDSYHDATETETEASSRHGATTEPRRQASSRPSDPVRELEIEVATLRGRLIEKDKRHVEDVEIINQLRTENGQLRLGIGEYKGRNVELEKRLALLEAPTPAPMGPEDASEEPPEQDAPEPERKTEAGRPGLWRRLFGSR